MRKSPETELNVPKFKKGNIVTCPSDLTGVKWKVVSDPDKNGNVEAVVLGGEKYPSKEYPRTVLIQLYAQAEWELVSES